MMTIPAIKRPTIHGADLGAQGVWARCSAFLPSESDQLLRAVPGAERVPGQRSCNARRYQNSATGRTTLVEGGEDEAAIADLAMLYLTRRQRQY